MVAFQYYNFILLKMINIPFQFGLHKSNPRLLYVSGVNNPSANIIMEGTPRSSFILDPGIHFH